MGGCNAFGEHRSRWAAWAALAALLLAGAAGCGGGGGPGEAATRESGRGTGPADPAPAASEAEARADTPSDAGRDRRARSHRRAPIRFPATDPDQVALGKLLFFDKELSGNRNIACATCHHPLAAIGDGLSMPVGEGARGLGVARDTGSGADAVHERVPRNAPHLFNLGAEGFDELFWDGRISVNPDHPSGYDSPAGDDLPPGLPTVLAAQAMFPVTSNEEMAGQPGENPVADAVAAGNLAGPGGVWALLAERLRAIPEYVALFEAAFDDVDGAEDITFVHVATALGAFEADAFRADDSPFDRFLRGRDDALSGAQKRGMALFNGRAGCVVCHSGPLQTDHRFHTIALPQIGPGKGDGVNGREDFGRERVTGDPADRYRFRTPSLRNVALTAPYGHSGAFNTLEAHVRHYRDTAASLRAYDPSQAALPSRPDLDALDFEALAQPAVVEALAAATEAPPRGLSDRDVADLVAFLHALTDPAMLDMRHLMPERVPSGLPLAD
jgi:cytochrome c peroxidase